MYPTYEVVQVNGGARRWVREILVCIPIATCLLYFIDHNVFFDLGTFAFALFAFGIIGGVILWAIYRILRFALGDTIQPVYRIARGVLVFIVIVACTLYLFLRFNGFPTF